MKCQFCSKEPIRACLVCGVFYCETHGRYSQNITSLQKARLSSLCQNCSGIVGKNLKAVGKVFGMIGLGMTVLGASLVAILGDFIPGGIFLIQGLVFCTLGLVFSVARVRTPCDDDR